MSAAKHTPGPWLARRNYYGGEQKFTPYVSAGDTAKVLCFMNISGAYGGFAGQEKAEADARLIAAAPELLETLREVLAGYESERGDAFDWPAWADKASKTISKATGGQP